MRFFLVFVLLISLATSCDKFDKYRNLFCKYGTEQTPCTIESYSAFQSACCSLAGGCSYSEFPVSQVCCFTQKCLQRCYPGKKYQVGTVY